MTEGPAGRTPGPDPAGDPARRATDRPGTDRPERARTGIDRARIDEVFGETLPETPSDESRGRGGRIDDDWWRDQRPPHHG